MSVVITHTSVLMIKLPNGQQPFTATLSAMGMSLFFVLSGFVIHANYSGMVSTASGLWNFFVARFARLYPLYFAFLCLDLLMKIGFHQFKPERIAALPYYLTLTQSWFYLPIDGQSLIFQYGIVPQVTWSISTEWFFYLTFPLLCIVIAPLRRPRQIISAIIALCAASLVGVTLINFFEPYLKHIAIAHYGQIAITAPDDFDQWLTYFSPYVRVLEFALGVLISALVRALPAPEPTEQRLGAILTLAAVAGAVLMQWVAFFAPGIPAWVVSVRANFGFAPALGLLVFCCVRYDSPVSRMLSAPRIVLLGEASYSIYLSHMIMIDNFRFQVPTITDPQIWIVTILQMTISMAATVGLSLVLWTAVEMPARRTLRRWLATLPNASSRKAAPKVEAAAITEPAE
jgi:peptidoglycan/LPS O-acetylase OafA/YrhL